MMSEAINSWTFSELVAAFFDLSIVYCLLCASAVAFFASRCLAIFGLCLPCPREGLFWNSRNSNDHCLQRQLVDSPYEKISSVYFLAKSEFPFDSLLGDDERNGNLRLKLGSGGNDENENAELECGSSSGSFPERRLDGLSVRDLKSKPGPEFDAVNLEGLKDQKYEAEGKRVGGQRPRHLLRCRRKGGFVNYVKKLSPVSSNDTLQSDARSIPQSPPSISKIGDGVTEDPNNYRDDKEAPRDFGFLERVSPGLESNNSNNDLKHVEREALLVEESGCGAKGLLDVDKNEKNTIRMLEQALEEVHAACSALYLELEKDRSAAATAADEAMAMILRLQKEKASIEMEARQCQRMIEARAAYQAEEMNILKEILLRREREKHFLEKEVEMYTQMILENDQSDSNVQDVADLQVQKSSTFYSWEDPVLLLQQMNVSIEKPKLKFASSSSRYEVSSVETQNFTLALGKELAIPEPAEDDNSLRQVGTHENLISDRHSDFSSGSELNHEFKEKVAEKVVPKWEADFKYFDLNAPKGLDMLDKSVTLFVEDPDQSGGASLCTDLAAKSSDI